MSVFISYSHADQDFVDSLSLRLLNENIKVWRDEYKLSAGESLTARITARWARTSPYWRAAMNQFAILYEAAFHRSRRKMRPRMDAAGAVDAKNAPTAPWKTAQSAVSHSAHTHHRLVREGRKELR
jgi:hypothetical protein